MMLDRLRLEVKPAEISDHEWEKSKCDESPTGSHCSPQQAVMYSGVTFVGNHVPGV